MRLFRPFSGQMGSDEQEAQLVADHLIARLAGHDSRYRDDPKLHSLILAGHLPDQSSCQSGQRCGCSGYAGWGLRIWSGSRA